MGPGVVGVVEAAYSVLDGDEAWLRAMAERVVGLLGRGLGGHAYVYDLAGPDRFRTLQHVTGDADETWRAQWAQLVETPSVREFLHVCHRNQPRLFALCS